MATTPGGLPYPLPTDPIAGGADAIKALAEAIVGAWVNPTLAANFTATQPVQVRKVLGGVELRGSLSSSAAITTSTTMLTLPAGYFPTNGINIPLLTGLTSATGAQMCQLAISAGGAGVTIQPRGIASIAAGTLFYLDVVRFAQ